jgi:hypothetical protein
LILSRQKRTEKGTIDFSIPHHPFVAVTAQSHEFKSQINMLRVARANGKAVMKTASIQKKTPMSYKTVQRIMRRVPYQKGFRFSTRIGEYTGQVATSLEDFAETLKTVDLKSIDFHMERRDFEKWVVSIFGDEELAHIINRRSVFQGENRRNELVMAIQNHLKELKKMPKTA